MEHARANIEAGNAVLDTDARQAQWYADVAGRQVAPVLEPAAMLRCKVGRCQQTLCLGSNHTLSHGVFADATQGLLQSRGFMCDALQVIAALRFAVAH